MRQNEILPWGFSPENGPRHSLAYSDFYTPAIIMQGLHSSFRRSFQQRLWEMWFYWLKLTGANKAQLFIITIYYHNYFLLYFVARQAYTLLISLIQRGTILHLKPTQKILKTSICTRWPRVNSIGLLSDFVHKPSTLSLFKISLKIQLFKIYYDQNFCQMLIVQAPYK